MYIAYSPKSKFILSNPSDELVLKKQGQAAKIFQFFNGRCEISTDDLAIGDYTLQLIKDGEVIAEDILTVKQNLKYAAADYDPRSSAQIAYQAISAYLEGRATTAQKRVTCGDKTVEYLTLSQLLAWRDYFWKQIRIEQGKAGNLRYEKLMYRGL